MDKAKIEIKVGIVEFIGEGEQDWLSKQLDKVMDKLPELLRIELSSPSNSAAPTAIENLNTPVLPENTDSTSSAIPSNLATYLREKNATSNQVNKFLLAAIYLQKSGKTRISTTEISQALKSSNQSKLANASDALNKNVGKGYCEKDGTQFFVTQEGLDFAEKLK